MRKADRTLRAAISALGRTRRRALTASLARQRDTISGRDPAMADFYNAVAALVADVSDDEDAALRRLQRDLDTPPRTS